MRVFILFVCFTITSVFSYAQGSTAEKEIINAYTIEANRLIWHININIRNLAEFQEEINSWYTNNASKIYQAPSFVFSPYEQTEEIQAILKSNKIKASNPAFNYKSTLENLNKQIILFNTFCKQLHDLSKSGSKQNYYSKGLTILYQIDNMAPEMVDLCYDFSLSCAINYGKEKLPVELDRLKNTVGQAKNVIMAMRENDPVQTKAYLNQLNIAIASGMSDVRLNDLKRVGRFQLQEYKLKEIHLQILEAANQIAFWAEQYLQSNYSEGEVAPILRSAIMAFNVQEGQAGCSGAYNEMIAYSSNEYLHFTEEPMFFEVNEQELEPELIATIEVKKDTIVVINPIAEAITKVESVSETEPIEVKAFDENDLYSLDGSLPNNIIIMMDVSASMKLTGKLPLLKSSILHLLDIMRPEDRISLIAYSGQADVLIANAGITDISAIKVVLDTLHSSGGTDIKKGLTLGYETAISSFMINGNNRIIIATDGEFGVRKDLLDLVQGMQSSRVHLSVFQFNEMKKQMKNESLENLAQLGRGSYKTITTSQEALEVLMQEVKIKN